MPSVVYEAFRFVFRTTSSTFYASFDVKSEENVPADGATIICFNHGNSLGDPVVLISNFPRQICFCAKHTLWKVPIFGDMVKASGALPIYRKQDVKDGSEINRADFNAATFSAVYKALHDQKVVAFAPEGVSKFLSYAAKFRSGVAFIALEALTSSADPDITINILPTCMTFTHREKFRSDVCLRYLEPIKLNKAFIKSQGHTLKDLETPEVKKKVANFIIEKLESEFHEYLISSPDWESVKLAITATRIHRPLGTMMSLSRYLLTVKGWLEVIKKRNGSELVKKLRAYQVILDSLLLKDERFNRLIQGKKMRSTSKVALIVAYRGILSMILIAICGPGLLLWSPIWMVIKGKEKSLLSNGETWVDSVAEFKMMYGFFGFLIFITGSFLFSVSKWSIPISVVYMLLMVRCYEEIVACIRSVGGVVRLWYLHKTDPQKIKDIVKLRQQLAKLIEIELKSGSFSNRIRDDILKETEGEDDILKMWEDKEHKRHSIWKNFNPFRRRKKDWNELLRLSDYCTMDYVE